MQNQSNNSAVATQSAPSFDPKGLAEVFAKHGITMEKSGNWATSIRNSYAKRYADENGGAKPKRDVANEFYQMVRADLRPFEEATVAFWYKTRTAIVTTDKTLKNGDRVGTVQFRLESPSKKQEALDKKHDKMRKALKNAPKAWEAYCESEGIDPLTAGRKTKEFIDVKSTVTPA